MWHALQVLLVLSRYRSITGIICRTPDRASILVDILILLITIFSQHNAKHLRLFSAFYWVDLALHMVFSVASAFLFFSMHSEVCEQIVHEAPKDEPIDMETCESAYIGSAWVITIAMAINLLLKVKY